MKDKAITLRHQGRVRLFWRTSENLQNGDIPGRVGQVRGVLRITGQGFKFIARGAK